jgi:vacuolar protein sorting-associated protein VTA1
MWDCTLQPLNSTVWLDNLQGIQMKSRGPKFEGVLRALIAKLERDKPAAGLGDNDKEYCRNFAESIFARADKIDRAGRADKGTCLTFYAATIFIEVWGCATVWIP